MLELAGWALIGAGVLLVASRFPRSAWQPHVVAATFAGYAPLPLVLGTLVLATTGGPWPAGGALVLAVLALQVAPRLRRRHPGPPVLTVLTANIWCGRGDGAAIVGLVRSRRVDVVALQELTDEALAALEAAGLDRVLPHRVVAPAPDWEGAGLWSRFPLRDAVVERRGTLYRVSAVVCVDGQPSATDPRVTSVHIHAPWPGPPRPWVEQLEEVRETLATRGRPLIVAGDFNATTGHAQFRRLLTVGEDAAISARPRAIRTWPQHLPVPALIALDHVLLGGLSADLVSTHEVPGSDHRAVIARVVRGRAPQAT